LLDQALARERGRGYSKGFGSNLAQDFACDFTPLPCAKDKGKRWCYSAGQPESGVCVLVWSKGGFGGD
jgi:hypothetical protein